MRRTSQLAFLLITGFVSMGATESSGCGAESSASVEQSRIHTGYWLYFNANNNATYARAQFRLGHGLGTVLELMDPAKVSFDKSAMAFNPVLSWHEAVVQGQVVEGTFNYVDTKGTTLTNPVRLERTVDFPADFPTRAKKSEGFEVRWVGPAIAKDEDLEVVVRGESALNFVRVDQINLGATSVFIPASELAKINGSAGIVTLRRHSYSAPAQAPEAGGRVQTTWEPKERTVALE